MMESQILFNFKKEERTFDLANYQITSKART